MKRVYLSLGSNIGNREANLKAAIEQLDAGGVRVLRVSPVYETAPVDATRGCGCTGRWASSMAGSE